MKTKSYFLLLIFSVVFSNFFMNAQTLQPENPDFCGTDFLHNQNMDNNPLYKARHTKAMKSIQKISSQKRTLIGGILQVPVVIHVMHKGEAIGVGTNISDEDVKNGLRYLNNYWRKVAGSQGDGVGVDMKIEFVLAVQDENGNCTDGIDRVDMSGVPAYVSDGVRLSGSTGLPDYDSSGGINSLKEYSIWDSNEYYNVWLVDEIDNKNCSSTGPFTAGYALFASAHGQPNDGSVVLTCTFLNESSSIWAHEMGHAFNLPHTFSGDDSGTNCPSGGDDGIADTPKHIRTLAFGNTIYNDCDNMDANACDPTFDEEINPDTGFRRDTGTRQDHMHNYMDYSGCTSEFTGGQRAVTTAALNGVRSSFLTSPALTPPALATVFFTSDKTNVCLGESIEFTDESACTPNSYTNSGYDNASFLWTIDNGVDAPYTSTVQSPTITFNNAGTYDVTLAVTNPQGTTSLTKMGSINASSGVIAGASGCNNVTSSNDDGNFGTGVTNVSFHTLNNATSTSIPVNPVIQDFTCSNSTTVNVGTSYDLDVIYESINGFSQYLEVWIDWDNDGVFQISNSNGDNERVLTDNVPSGSGGFHTPSGSVTPPATATLNTLLRMRVISNASAVPSVCGNGFGQRADDYGVTIKAACTPPTASITNNSGVTVLTCMAPSISLTATGGVSYSWNNNMGITPTISVTEPGTYTVTVTDSNGCTDDESIVITENKPLPTAVITNNTGTTALTCDITSISVTASGGASYSWDNGLGNNASASITSIGTYTVTVTAANGCTDTESVVIIDAAVEPTTCIPTSFNTTNNPSGFGLGVTNVSFNTIDNDTNLSIPPNAINNFICSDNTTLDIGTSYDLTVDYTTSTVNTGAVFLEVWIDWDNSGAFESSNSNGENEQVLVDDIAAGATGSPTVSISPPATATLGTLLRMRVISEYLESPTLCGGGSIQRADDYGVTVTNTLNSIDFVKSQFKIYPNPVGDYLTISSKNNSEIKRLEILDITGKQLNSKKIVNTIEGIDVSKLPSGFYFLKLKTDTASLIFKFVKK
ncbi:GEVED domain-containing protein [Algibacter sp. 2305UL17-15]|uniref:GEVED domain-containing protein n=1 Tax=Algibacter sp. 2305UL17-15 TaxID=3231268 RepID=UPI003458BB6C